MFSVTLILKSSLTFTCIALKNNLWLSYILEEFSSTSLLAVLSTILKEIFVTDLSLKQNMAFVS